jgi:hypothetical protein
MHKILHLANHPRPIVIAAIALMAPTTALASSAHQLPRTHHVTGHVACSTTDHHSCKPASRRSKTHQPTSSDSRLHHHRSAHPSGNPPTSTPPTSPTPPSTTPTSPSETSPAPTPPPETPSNPTSPPTSPSPSETPPTTTPPTTIEAPLPAGEAPVPTITGTTYYVSPSGSDSNSGTSPSSPWRTVNRVNDASLAPGDGVLFQGGATFSGELTGNAGGENGKSITYGSYGTGNAILSGEIWDASHNFLTFNHLTVTRVGGRGSDVTVQNSNIGNTPYSGINVALGNGWHILHNRIHNTGDSGILTQSGEEEEDKPGEFFVIEGNVIENTGNNSSLTYGKHGIYLKARNTKVVDNTITNFSSDGISQRYSNCLLKGNKISGGEIGIAYFEYDHQAGTSEWVENEVTNTDTGFYAPLAMSGAAPAVESFVLSKNAIGPLKNGSHDWINMLTAGTIADPGGNTLD